MPTLIIQVVDQDGDQLEDVVITINGVRKNISHEEFGLATFEDLPLGECLFSINTGQETTAHRKNLVVGVNKHTAKVKVEYEEDDSQNESEVVETNTEDSKAPNEKGSKRKYTKVKIILLACVVAAFGVFYWIKSIPPLEFVPVPTQAYAPTEIYPNTTQVNARQILAMAIGILVFVVGFLESKSRGQQKDVWAAVVAISIIMIGEPIVNWVAPLYSGVSALLFVVVALVILYLFSLFVGGKDLTAPGVFWGLMGLSGIAFNNLGALELLLKFPNNTFYSFGQVVRGSFDNEFPLVSFSFAVYAMIFISLFNFAWDLLGKKVEITKAGLRKTVTKTWEVRIYGIVKGILQVVAFYVVHYLWRIFPSVEYIVNNHFPPLVSLILSIVGFIILAAAAQPFSTGNKEVSGEGHGSVRFGKFMGESSWDSVNFGLMLFATVLFTKLFPVVW